MYGKCYKHKGKQLFLMVRSEIRNGQVDCTQIVFDGCHSHLSKATRYSEGSIMDYFTEFSLTDFKKAYKDFLQAADVIYKDAVDEGEGA